MLQVRIKHFSAKNPDRSRKRHDKKPQRTNANQHLALSVKIIGGGQRYHHGACYAATVVGKN